MNIPEGYEKENNKICCLNKALYGLKQSSLCWNERFSKFIKLCGLYPLTNENCIFRNTEGNLILAIYVDDGILAGQNNEDIENLLMKMENEFKMTKNDNVDEFLGIKIIRNENSIKLNQKSYVESLLRKFGMENAKGTVTPMENYDTNKVSNNQLKDYPYREVVGTLLFLSNRTRPDISFSVGFCSRYQESPSEFNINNVKRIMRYLITSKDDGIVYKNYENDENYKMIAYSDADFAGDPETRKSTTGYVIYFCNGLISWCSKKQPIVSLSSTEAEYISAAECVKELLYLKELAEELLNKKIIVILYMDNQSAMMLIKNGQLGKRSKHIDVRFHFIMEKVQEGLLEIKYMKSEEMIADILTKPLQKIKFQKHKKCLVE